MNHAAAQVVQEFFAVLNQAMWVIIGGFAVIGAAFYGGPVLVAAWREAAQERKRRRLRAAAIRQEAHGGIAELEAFLEHQGKAPDHRPDTAA